LLHRFRIMFFAAQHTLRFGRSVGRDGGDCKPLRRPALGPN
jgi:hypothetical protein